MYIGLLSFSTRPNKFPDKWKDNDKAEIKIVYLSLQNIDNEVIIKKAKIDIKESQRSYLRKPIILDDIVNNREFTKEFTNMLKSEKRAKWEKVKDILKELLLGKNDWFLEKKHEY